MRRRIEICLALAMLGALPGAAAESPSGWPAIRLQPASPDAAARERMRKWHRETRGHIAPVLREWRAVARAERERPGLALSAGCRRLDLELGRLHRARLQIAPDPSVSLHLEETLIALSEAADSCSNGAFFLASWRLRQADASWRELRGRLLLYDLAP